MNWSFSDWAGILVGVPQDSILGPLLWNIFLNGIFLFATHSNLCNYTDDNTLYTINEHLHVVKPNLEANVAIMQMQNGFIKNIMFLILENAIVY